MGWGSQEARGADAVIWVLHDLTDRSWGPGMCLGILDLGVQQQVKHMPVLSILSPLHPATLAFVSLS